MKTDEAPEIIEIIDDDTDAFGPRQPDQTSHDSGGPRWIGPVAATALVALIGYGVATSSSTDSTPKAAPVTSTTAVAPTTTRPAPTPTTDPSPPVPYYAAEVSADYVVRFADVFQTGLTDQRSGAHELWATPDATATSGSWFSVETTPEGGRFRSVNAQRVPIAGYTAALSHTPFGHTVIQFATEQGFGVTVTSFGWSDEQLARLIGSLTLTSRDFIGFEDPWFTSDHELITRVPMWSAVWGPPDEIVYYANATHPSKGIVINVATPPTDSFAGPAPDRATALRFTLDHVIPFEVNRHSATAGRAVGQEGQSLATWVEDGKIVSVMAPLPVAELIAVARTVRQVGPTEWQAMQQQAGGDNSTFIEGSSAPVASGNDAAGVAWAVTATVRTEGNLHFVTWGWNDDGWSTYPEDSPEITALVTEDRTYVFAVVPRALAAMATLNVIRAGADPVSVTFVDAGPTSEWILAAYAFSEPVPFTAEITAGDGTVLATWPAA